MKTGEQFIHLLNSSSTYSFPQCSAQVLVAYVISWNCHNLALFVSVCYVRKCFPMLDLEYCGRWYKLVSEF